MIVLNIPLIRYQSSCLDNPDHPQHFRHIDQTKQRAINEKMSDRKPIHSLGVYGSFGLSPEKAVTLYRQRLTKKLM